MNVLGSRFYALVQAAGFKYIRLFAPEETTKLYPRMHPRADKANRAKEPNVSKVRVELPDPEAHPLFVDANYVEMIIGPGDMLFIPKGTWHYIRSLTTSLSINFWF